MKNLKVILLAIVVLLGSIPGFGQAPGGVSTGLSVWFKADNSTTLTGNPVSSWRSSGGTATGFTISQSTAANRPSIVNGANNYVKFNYNPRIKFGPNLTTLQNVAITPNLLGNSGTAIMVTDQNLDGTAFSYYSNTSYRYQSKPSWRYQTGAVGTGYLFDWTPPTEYSSTSASIISGYGCGSTLALRLNSVQDNTPTFTSTTYNPSIVQGLCVGANGVAEPSSLGIAEIIFFDNKPTLAEMNKIETYLAIKYGITLGGNNGTTSAYNYVSASNTVIWDKTVNTGYNRDIAVIGREVASGLAQKQSISVNNGEALTISLGNAAIPSDNATNPNSFTADASFLAWGNNGLTPMFNSSANKPGGISGRVNRIWKTQATNFSELTTFGFETARVIGLGAITDLCLLFDEDGDFSNATVAGACTAINPTGTRVEFPGISIPSGKPFVTLARVQLPTFTVSSNGPICAGSDLNLTVTDDPNTTYSWTGPNGFTSISSSPVITSATVAASSPPDYIVTATTSGGCITTVSTTAIVNPSIVPTIIINASTGNTICEGEAVNFTSTVTNEGSAPVYQWKLNGVTVGTNSSTYSNTALANSDVITCELTSNGPCANPALVSSNALNFSVLPKPIADAGSPVTIYSGQQTQLAGSATNANNYLWTPDIALSSTVILTPTANPTATQLYTLTVSNALGCSASDDVLVTVITQCINLKNAFTPNGDGINELWLVYDQFDCLKNVAVHVYNRYGSEVYANKDYRNNWDGRYKGKPVPDGTYYAVIQYTLLSGTVTTKQTDLTILR